jgi:threonine/homoserine/homoserine lactone efflux protein
MQVVTHIMLGVIVSFGGFLPIGMTNVAVADSAIKYGIQRALTVAMGAVSIGIVQAFISLYCSGYIMTHPKIEEALTWISIPFLIGIGIYYYRQRNAHVTSEMHKSREHGFAKGALVSTMNVLAIPFYFFYASFFSSLDLIELNSVTLILVFSLGAGLGMLLALMLYARLGMYADKKITRLQTYSTTIISVVMFGLGLLQVIRVIIE